MQSGPIKPKNLVIPSTDSDGSARDSVRYVDMPESASLQRSPPIHPLRMPGPIPVSPAGPLPELAEGSKPIAIQYAMMLKAQSDREAAIAFREAHAAKKPKKGCCALF